MRIAMIVPVLLMTAAANAQDFSYRFIDASASQSKNNESDITLDTANVTVSLQSHAGALLQLSLGAGQAEDIPRAAGGPDGDVRSFEAFVGGARQLTESTSAWTGFGLGRTTIEPDNSRSKAEIDTARFALGIRHWLVSGVEAHGTTSILYFDNNRAASVDDAELRLGLRFYPLSGVSLNIEAAYQFDQRVEIAAASLRYDF